MLRVITALECLHHHFAKLGHRNTSCDPHLHQTIEQPTLHYLTRSVRRRAATSKRNCVDHSVRSARMGSMVAARHAGTRHAMSATKTRIKEDAISVRGSRELPPDQDENTRCSATLRINPRARPMPRVMDVEASTKRTMLVRGAPSAMRMPTS